MKPPDGVKVALVAVDEAEATFSLSVYVCGDRYGDYTCGQPQGHAGGHSHLDDLGLAVYWINTAPRSTT